MMLRCLLPPRLPTPPPSFHHPLRIHFPKSAAAEKYCSVTQQDMLYHGMTTRGHPTRAGLPQSRLSAPQSQSVGVRAWQEACWKQFSTSTFSKSSCMEKLYLSECQYLLEMGQPVVLCARSLPFGPLGVAWTPLLLLLPLLRCSAAFYCLSNFVC